MHSIAREGKSQQHRAASSVPPHSVEAEQGLLGCTLLDPTNLTMGLERFAPDAFYIAAHQLIFAGMKALASQGQSPVDILNLGDWLEQAGKLDEIPNGRAYLTSLCEATFSPAMFSTYVHRVEGDWRKRQVLDLGLRLASKNAADVDESVHDIERTLAAVKTVPAEPQVQRTGDDFLFSWPIGITVAVTLLRESRDGLHGEITVNAVDRRLHWGDLRLASLSAREDLTRKLERARGGFQWEHVLERVCATVAQEYRAGEPVMLLRPAAGQVERYLFRPLVVDGEISVIFGDGGAGKSLLSLALGVGISTGTPLAAGLEPVRRVPSLLLDWESHRPDHEDRLAGVLTGLGLDGSACQIFYRPMARALADDVDRVRAEVRKYKDLMLIVDSLAPACGAEPEGADAAVRFFNAVRSLAPLTCLVVAHMSKADADRGGRARPFGSVFVQNLARSVWEVRRSEETEDLVLGLFHRKANYSRLHPPIGLRFTFDNNMIRIRSGDIAGEPDLLARTTLSYRIQQVLRAGARTTKELAELCETSEAQVRARCNDLKEARKLIVIGSEGRQTRWGLSAR